VERLPFENLRFGSRQDAALAVRGDNSRAAANRAALATFFFIMSLELGVE